jgi:NifU-like protein involved in Fe-S cluster formation
MNSDPFQENADLAALDTENLGELPGADAIGTAGGEDCGDMLRVWIKFREENGKKVIERATYQSFGCQTALAVAATAARLLQGRTAEEALAMGSDDLSAPLGSLPPMKIHCAQLVESALRDALAPGHEPSAPPAQPSPASTVAPALFDSLTAPAAPKMVFLPKPESSGSISNQTIHPEAAKL